MGPQRSSHLNRLQNAVATSAFILGVEAIIEYFMTDFPQSSTGLPPTTRIIYLFMSIIVVARSVQSRFRTRFEERNMADHLNWLGEAIIRSSNYHYAKLKNAIVEYSNADALQAESTNIRADLDRVRAGLREIPRQLASVLEANTAHLDQSIQAKVKETRDAVRKDIETAVSGRYLSSDNKTVSNEAKRGLHEFETLNIRITGLEREKLILKKTYEERMKKFQAAMDTLTKQMDNRISKERLSMAKGSEDDYAATITEELSMFRDRLARLETNKPAAELQQQLKGLAQRVEECERRQEQNVSELRTAPKEIDSLLERVSSLETRLTAVDENLDTRPQETKGIHQKLDDASAAFHALSGQQKDIDSLRKKLDHLFASVDRLNNWIPAVEGVKKDISTVQEETRQLRHQVEWMPNKQSMSKYIEEKIGNGLTKFTNQAKEHIERKVAENMQEKLKALPTPESIEQRAVKNVNFLLKKLEESLTERVNELQKYVDRMEDGIYDSQGKKISNIHDECRTLVEAIRRLEEKLHSVEHASKTDYEKIVANAGNTRVELDQLAAQLKEVLTATNARSQPESSQPRQTLTYRSSQAQESPNPKPAQKKKSIFRPEAEVFRPSASAFTKDNVKQEQTSESAAGSNERVPAQSAPSQQTPPELGSTQAPTEAKESQGNDRQDSSAAASQAAKPDIENGQKRDPEPGVSAPYPLAWDQLIR